MKVLFILKSREDPYSKGDSKKQLSSGLFNSANFCNDYLNTVDDIESKLVHVIDNNCIDKEVTLYRPDIVIIEAYWVVPEKFDILQKLHPNVKWVIRNHSEVSFLANEGIAFDWSIRYISYKNVYLSCNSKQTCEDFICILKNVYTFLSDEDIRNRIIYLPNVYFSKNHELNNKDITRLDISCFGAIRPLKNHVVQLVAALRLANYLKLPLYFHINDGRIELKGDAILKNIQAIFNHSTKNKLVEHNWMDHSEFKEEIKKIDLGLQVSFTETFNIVAADHVSSGVPVVVSNNVPWLRGLFQHFENNSTLIFFKMLIVYKFKWVFLKFQQFRLNRWNIMSKKLWIKNLNSLYLYNNK